MFSYPPDFAGKKFTEREIIGNLNLFKVEQLRKASTKLASTNTNFPIFGLITAFAIHSFPQT